MGFKLLRDLGWKDGQGIGARRKRMSKKKNGMLYNFYYYLI